MVLPLSPLSRSLYCDCRDQLHRASPSCQKLIHTVPAQDTDKYTAEQTLILGSSDVRFTESVRFATGSQASSPTSHRHLPSTSSEFLSEFPIEDLLDLSALEDDSIFTSTGNVISSDNSQTQPPTNPTLGGGALLTLVGADNSTMPQSNVVPEHLNSNPDNPAEHSGWLSHKCGAANPDSGPLLPEAVPLQDMIATTRTCPFMTCRKSFKSPYALRRHFRCHYLAHQKQEISDMLLPTFKVKQRRQSSYPAVYTCSVGYSSIGCSSTSLREKDPRVALSVTEEAEQTWRQWTGVWWEEEAKQTGADTMLTCPRDDVDAVASPTGYPTTGRRERIFRAHLSSGSPWDITLTTIAAPPFSSESSTPSSDCSLTSLPSFTNFLVTAPLLDTPRDDGFPVSPASIPLTINPKEVVPMPNFIFDDICSPHLEIDQSLIDHGDRVDLERRSEPSLPVEENLTEESLSKQARTASLGRDRTSSKGRSTGQRPFQQDERKDSHASLDAGSMGATPTSGEATVLQSRKRGRPRRIPLTCPPSSPPNLGLLTQPRPVKRGRPPKSKVPLASPPSADLVSHEASVDLPLVSRSSAFDIKIGTEPHESQQETCVPSSPDPICERKPPLVNDHHRRKRKVVSYSDAEGDDRDPADDDYNYVEEEVPRPRKRRCDNEEEYQDRPRRKGRNKKFPCTVQGCSSTFVRKSDIERHIQRIHRNVSSLCPDCKLAFSRTDAVLRHIRVLHGKELGPDKRDFVTIET